MSEVIVGTLFSIALLSGAVMGGFTFGLARGRKQAFEEAANDAASATPSVHWRQEILFAKARIEAEKIKP